tara:strand:- start:369 stop:683 length:315 start_codon:yes stop_codon:yes gene_type:complete
MKTKDEVENLLIKTPHLKDDDNKLICSFWYYEMKNKGINPEDFSCMEFMNLIANSKLTNAKTIRRYRAKLQEEKPALRGSSYIDRQTAKQDIVKINLGYKQNNY